MAKNLSNLLCDQKNDSKFFQEKYIRLDVVAIIPESWEAEKRGFAFEPSIGKNVSETLSQKTRLAWWCTHLTQLLRRQRLEDGSLRPPREKA